jgi:hypothetical protein
LTIVDGCEAMLDGDALAQEGLRLVSLHFGSGAGAVVDMSTHAADVAPIATARAPRRPLSST